jgi:hypothetical protein
MILIRHKTGGTIADQDTGRYVFRRGAQPLQMKENRCR